MQANEHRSTSRVLDILEQLALRKEGMTLTELAQLLSAPKSSLFPIIHTMEQRGFLISDASSRYRIGPHAYLTGMNYENPVPMHSIIQEKMREIVAQCQETCHLGILAGPDVLYVAKIDSPLPIALRSKVGNRLPAYCTGVGKALIYPLSMAQLQALYPNGLTRYTSNTLTDIHKLYLELQEVKKTGFAYEYSEVTEGVQCIAVPLKRNGQILASLSICIPSFRSTPDKREEICQLLKSSQRELELRLEEYQIESSLFII